MIIQENRDILVKNANDALMHHQATAGDALMHH